MVRVAALVDSPLVRPPWISIVTPCFNAAATIEETLRSVGTQDYPQVEHIVVDGGSTDGTVRLLEGTPGIRWISEPDRGRVDAANKGARMASGDVVGWLNADDRYEPGTLQAVGEALTRDPQAAWATGYCRIVGADGGEIRSAITAYKNLLLRRWSLPLYLTQNFVSDPATFVRRSALEEVGLLDERYLMSHDYDLWLRVAERYGAPVILRRELACFRMTETTLSMAGFERQFREHAEIARVYGRRYPLAVAVNRSMSALIVFVYRVLRQRRRLYV
jgi:glycosyltransferase involved in cell wall biosynthesis